jgi:hypothetical protein
MEFDRKLRVLDQSLSMHTTQRDRYARRALVVDLTLLAGSVVFCASSFASDEALSHLGPTPQHVRLALQAFSVLAFMVSVLSLRIDWKGTSARHGDSAAKVSRAVATFRKGRQADGSWPIEKSDELDAVYWEAMHNSVPIPEASFVKLKARHLRKVELSRMLDSNPGCPVFVLRFKLLFSALRRARVKSREVNNQ